MSGDSNADRPALMARVAAMEETKEGNDMSDPHQIALEWEGGGGKSTTSQSALAPREATRRDFVKDA
ncbi:hypothetical protein [Mesorhizobium sp. WSM2561]|uniref:hypothetical protein n=1 Tax=Mesorhizobium sp. WSM2561 TaxID=1040985 RepID=UPI0004B93589|nr:hypothetical protein [Mesorhizobium sp. WSM2561]